MDSPMSEQFNELVVSPPSEAFEPSEPSEPEADNTFQIFVAGPEKHSRSWSKTLTTSMH